MEAQGIGFMKISACVFVKFAVILISGVAAGTYKGNKNDFL